jgi:hypothetical protein
MLAPCIQQRTNHKRRTHPHSQPHSHDR